MKTIIQIVLGVIILVLAYVLYQQIMTPMRFQKEVGHRRAAVIERIKDIRSAERGYKQLKEKYTGSFDTLISFVLNDSLTFERSFGSEDDSVSVAQNLVRRETFKMAVRDTIFGDKKLTTEQIEQLRYIPYGADNVQFILAAAMLETQSKVVVPVFEAKAPFKAFLSDLNQQQLVNLIDERENVYSDYAGIRVGSVISATNDAGNWE